MELSAITTKKDGFKKLILTVYVENILPVGKILDYPIQNLIHSKPRGDQITG